MFIGWSSIAIGILGLFIGFVGLYLSYLNAWLLSTLKVGTREEVKSRGVKPVFIRVPYLFIFMFNRKRTEVMHPLRLLLFCIILIPFTSFTTDKPDSRGLYLAFDVGNLSATLSQPAMVGSVLSIALGFISIVFGILSLAIPSVIFDTLPSKITLLFDWLTVKMTLLINNYPWMKGLFVFFIAVAVLLIWVIIHIKRKRSSPDQSSGEATETLQNNEKISDDLNSSTIQKRLLIHLKAHLLEKIGLFLLSIKRFNRGIVFIKKALELHKEVNELSGQASNLANLGVAFHLQGKLEQALNIIVEAMGLYKEAKYRNGEADCLVNIGTIYLKKRELDKTLDHYQRALTIYDEISNKRMCDIIEKAISEITDEGKHHEESKARKSPTKD